jgi:hypothetical protein
MMAREGGVGWREERKEEEREGERNASSFYHRRKGKKGQRR